MNILFIRKLAIMTFIGIHEWEQKNLQKLLFDLDIKYDKLVIGSDNISDYINYSSVVKKLIFLVENNKFILLESLAENVVKNLIYTFEKISWIRIKVSKPNAIQQAVNTGIIIERYRTDI